MILAQPPPVRDEELVLARHIERAILGRAAWRVSPGSWCPRAALRVLPSVHHERIGSTREAHEDDETREKKCDGRRLPQPPHLRPESAEVARKKRAALAPPGQGGE